MCFVCVNLKILSKNCNCKNPNGLKKKSLQRLIQINLLEVYKSLLITGEEMTRQSTYILKCTATFYKKKKLWKYQQL